MSERFSYSTTQLDPTSPRTLEEEHDLLKGIGPSDDIADFQRLNFRPVFGHAQGFPDTGKPAKRIGPMQSLKTKAADLTLCMITIA